MRVRSHERRGTAATEFALLLPILLSVLIGVVDGGLAMSKQHMLARAARDGARIGSMTIEPIPATGELIELAAEEAALRSLTAAGLTSGVFVTADWDVDESGLAWVTVVVSAEHRSILGPMSPLHGTHARSFTMLTQEQ